MVLSSAELDNWAIINYLVKACDDVDTTILRHRLSKGEQGETLQRMYSIHSCSHAQPYLFPI